MPGAPSAAPGAVSMRTNTGSRWRAGRQARAERRARTHVVGWATARGARRPDSRHRAGSVRSTARPARCSRDSTAALSARARACRRAGAGRRSRAAVRRRSRAWRRPARTPAARPPANAPAMARAAASRPARKPPRTCRPKPPRAAAGDSRVIAKWTWPSASGSAAKCSASGDVVLRGARWTRTSSACGSAASVSTGEGAAPSEGSAASRGRAATSAAISAALAV